MLILISLFLCPLTYVLYTCIYAILYNIQKTQHILCVCICITHLEYISIIFIYIVILKEYLTDTANTRVNACTPSSS